jgi:hypothetical protein
LPWLLVVYSADRGIIVSGYQVTSLDQTSLPEEAPVAQVARGRRIDPDIDYHLDYQFRAWASIPEYAEWWPTLDLVDKEVFHLEWTGITESRLKELAQWAEQGALTSAQSVRY